ncbi:MAG: LytTR family DNA-binding domain-containing protein [Vallitaleaceae bacterium]|jgi:DNA-binding LytR/AlgR family response regulator|nr:LytTR family DNA-binding domain-containing protein [Vallitaleaceae bacterium]
MLNIAICDDNIDDLSNMTSLMNDYVNGHMDKSILKYTAFQNALDLIAAIEIGEKYDVVLLDILMPFMTGMDAAKEIREYNHDVKIVFLTSSPEFAVESYSVSAYYYAIKPIWKEKLFILLDKLIDEIETHIKRSILIKSKTLITRIYIHRLEYAEINGRIILYHLTDGSVVEGPGSMTELENLLSDNCCFIKPHRSYIINMAHIDTISQRELKMQSLALVPISKANNAMIQAAYMKYSFKEQETFNNP